LSGGGHDSATLQELRGLEALEADMSRTITALRVRREAAIAAKTLSGRLQNAAGRVLAIYCVFRVINVGALAWYATIHLSVLLTAGRDQPSYPSSTDAGRSHAGI
jgi:hypothetical protein